MLRRQRGKLSSFSFSLVLMNNKTEKDKKKIKEMKDERIN